MINKHTPCPRCGKVDYLPEYSNPHCRCGLVNGSLLKLGEYEINFLPSDARDGITEIIWEETIWKWEHDPQRTIDAIEKALGKNWRDGKGSTERMLIYNQHIKYAHMPHKEYPVIEISGYRWDITEQEIDNLRLLYNGG